ncbi:octopamine receptor 1-like [Orbicella faveolata]|uniref:octopamine receptor 1-like n=1 Tax=Orbicella faveolata TaxID=48498 RepID=UPI0009E3EC76|nr:octopamine receptor 1-like [Orbicella faveolata]XP_020618888.1 octopamine receptor 1-like [Orbicella faveolata]XP_020618889.1 octopamine receptor 1-like [Orbicella faveolata]
MSNNSTSMTRIPTSFPAPQVLPTLPHGEVEIIFATIVYVLLALFVILGNSLVIAAFRLNSRLRTINNTFLVGLAVSDLLVGLISIPLWIYFSYCQQYLTCVDSQGLLTFYSTVDIFTGCASVLQLTAISIERYLAITRPINHRSYSMWIYYAMIAVAWSFAFIMAGLFPVQQQKWQKPYSVILFTTCFALPALVILTIYAIIFQTAKGTSRVRVQPAGTSMSPMQKEAKIAATIAVIAGLFVIAWLPFFVLNMIAEFCYPCLPPYPDILRLVRFVKWMHYSNSMVNPLVYAYRNAEMRKTFKRLLLSCFCGHRNGHRNFPASSRTAHARRRRNIVQGSSRSNRDLGSDSNTSRPGRALESKSNESQRAGAGSRAKTIP